MRTKEEIEAEFLIHTKKLKQLEDEYEDFYLPTKVELKVFPQDFTESFVNGHKETNDNLKMPCIKIDYNSEINISRPIIERKYWNIIIDAKTGYVENWQLGTMASVEYRVCDDGYYRFYNENNNNILELKQSYVPECLDLYDNYYRNPSKGKYIIYVINKEGYIENWKFVIFQHWFNINYHQNF